MDPMPHSQLRPVVNPQKSGIGLLLTQYSQANACGPYPFDHYWRIDRRILAFQGNDIIRDNHLGDWGTQFGILLLAIKEQNISLDDLGDDPIAKLEDLYRQGNARIKEDEVALTQARHELVKLQEGDSENLQLWEKIRDISMSSFLKIYDLLDVKFDHSLGESFTGQG